MRGFLSLLIVVLIHEEIVAWELPEEPIIVNSVKEIDAKTAQSVSASLGLGLPKAKTGIQLAPVATTALGRPNVCHVCNQALQMAQSMYLREAAAGATAQSAGLPLFIQGMCSDLKVDYQLRGLPCGSVKARFETFYQSEGISPENLVRPQRGGSRHCHSDSGAVVITLY